MSQYRPTGFRLLPDVVKNLLIINGLFFLATIVLQLNFNIDLKDILGLHYPDSQKFEIYQLVSYMFMHGNFSHLFFNMFAVWMFGSAIENVWGGKRFLVYYLITGLGAAAIHYLIVYFQINPDLALMESFINDPTVDRLANLINSHHPKSYIHPQIAPLEIINGYNNEFLQALQVLKHDGQDPVALRAAADFMRDYMAYFKNLPVVVGASGSLFGLLLAFGMMFPNATIYLLFFPFPIKAKYFVIGYGLLELFSGLQNNPEDNVAHFAHLGGMLFGYLLIMFWRKTNSKGF